MFSVSPAEILTIAVVALIVFGPRRLPEITRKLGRVLRDVRAAAADLRSGIEAEFDEVGTSLDDVRRDLGTLDEPEDKPRSPGGPSEHEDPEDG